MQEHSGGHSPGREEPGIWDCEGHGDSWPLGLASCLNGVVTGKEKRGSFPKGRKSRVTFNRRRAPRFLTL